MSTNKLNPHDPRIANADPIEVVWPNFVAWCNKVTTNLGRPGLLVAWNGLSCDVKWMFKLTSPSGKWKLKMPEGVQFFCDPCSAIKHYKSCKLNGTKTGRNHALGTIYEFITGNQLLDAHNSLIDAKAQLLVFHHQYFRKFLDTGKTIQLMENALQSKMRKQIKQDNELTKPVPLGWEEDS